MPGFAASTASSNLFVKAAWSDEQDGVGLKVVEEAGVIPVPAAPNVEVVHVHVAEQLAGLWSELQLLPVGIDPVKLKQQVLVRRDGEVSELLVGLRGVERGVAVVRPAGGDAERALVERDADVVTFAELGKSRPGRR